MNSHDELDLLSAYLDDEVTAEERARVERHLPLCAECSATLEALRATVAALREDPAPEPTPQDSWALRAAVAAARRRSDRAGRRMIAVAGVAAAVVAIAGVSLGTLNRSAGRGGDDAGVSALGAAPAQELVVADPRDFDEGSVDALIAERFTMSAAADAKRAGTEGAAEMSGPFSARSDGSDPTTCAGTVERTAKDPLTPVAYVAASWKGEPAFLLLYRVEGRTARAELWVTAASDCRVLFFRQRPA